MRADNKLKIKTLNLHLIVSVLGASWLSGYAVAAETDISNMPLSKSTGQTVSPNIQFIIDDSGSMAWDYAPDAIVNVSGYCKEGRKGGTRNVSTCSEGEAPYFNSKINTIYYNPENRYDPVILPNGYSYAKESLLGKPMNSANTNGWKSVPADIYRISTTSNSNLITGYPNAQWCNSTSSFATCVTDTSYAYPDSTYFYKKNYNGEANYYVLLRENSAQIEI